MKRIESDIIAFDIAAFGKEHELGKSRVETHALYCDDLIRWAGGSKFATILADPPWRFQNSTGKEPYVNFNNADAD